MSKKSSTFALMITDRRRRTGAQVLQCLSRGRPQKVVN